MSLQYPLSKRECFAAAALQGMLANNDCEFWTAFDVSAERAYQHADAMLARGDLFKDLRQAVEGAIAKGQSIDPKWLKKWLAKQEAP